MKTGDSGLRLGKKYLSLQCRNATPESERETMSNLINISSFFTQGQQPHGGHHFPVSVFDSSFTDENIVSIQGGTVSAAFFI